LLLRQLVAAADELPAARGVLPGGQVFRRVEPVDELVQTLLVVQSYAAEVPGKLRRGRIHLVRPRRERPFLPRPDDAGHDDGHRFVAHVRNSRECSTVSDHGNRLISARTPRTLPHTEPMRAGRAVPVAPGAYA
jgi:hypothetical protein